MPSKLAKKPVLEKTIKTAVKKRLTEIGAYHHWPVQMGLGDACLDCHGCFLGFYFAVETKRPGGKLTARQKFTIERIEKSGGRVYVIDSIDAASKILDDRFEGNQAAVSPLRGTG